jgi:TolA-binding protein
MKDALEDLSPLARRGQLSGPEEQRLEVALESSADARLFHELGRRFDAEDPSAPMADKASEAVVESVLKDLRKDGSQKRRKLPRTAWLIAAAALLAASLAGAVIGVQRLRGVAAPTPSASEPRALPGARPAIDRSPAPVAPLIASSEQPAPPASSAELPAPRALPSSPAELLSAAGRARRSGQSARAVELLQNLRSRYPNSPEAGASEITLAELQLERGAAAAALGHYDAYLRRSPGGALGPEALWGRAQALTRLGRSAEAQKSLSDLLQRYPNSPYASAARAKLGAAAPRRP